MGVIVGLLLRVDDRLLSLRGGFENVDSYCYRIVRDDGAGLLLLDCPLVIRSY